MPSTNFPAPATTLPFEEHEVARPENAGRLKAAIPDHSEKLAELHRKHIISVKHFSPDLLLQLFRQAARHEMGEIQNPTSASCKVMSCLFMDHARSQTRLSFNRAWLCLGGTFLNIEKTLHEMLPNRMDPHEIAELCNSFSDLAVVRTPDVLALDGMLKFFRVPLINAGNGSDENPTHGLADLYTLLKWRPELIAADPPAEKRLQIGIIGNPSDTYTIRSFLYALTRFPQMVERIVVLERLAQPFRPGQREELEQAGLRIESVMELYPYETIMDSFRKLVPDLDVVYIHNLQKPQVSRMDLMELRGQLKPDALVLDPERHFPEYSELINDSPHNGFFAQARGGVFVRMALLAAVMRR